MLPPKYILSLSTYSLVLLLPASGNAAITASLDNWSIDQDSLLTAFALASLGLLSTPSWAIF